MSWTPSVAVLPARRLLLLALASALLLLLVSPSASAATPTIRQRSLTVKVADGVLTATTSVTSSKRVRVDALGVCVRTPDDHVYDLPTRSRVRLSKKAKAFTFSGSAALPAGSYRVGTCVKVKGTWTKVRGWQGVTVPDQPETTSPAPAPAPTGDATSTAPAVPAALTGRWGLQLDQSFSGTQLDRSMWQPSRWGGTDDQTPFNPDLEDAQFNAQNVSVADDTLSMRTTLADTTSGGRSYRYRSGTVSTQGTFALREGSYVEAQIRIPKGDGLWPAFWAVPTGEWPPEVDIFEFFDTATDARPAFNYHYRDAAGQLQQTGPHRYGLPGVDYRSGWHTYGLQRTGGRLVPWLDGVPYPDASTPGPGDVPLYLILNLSVRRGATAPAGASMDVRHVRAWTNR